MAEWHNRLIMHNIFHTNKASIILMDWRVLAHGMNFIHPRVLVALSLNIQSTNSKPTKSTNIGDDP
jgi:hypothetical protein